MTDLELVHLLCGFRALTASERELQIAIEAMLRQNGVKYLREAPLTPRDRPDFLIGDIALELKVSGSQTTILGQLLRYAESPRVAAIVLLTTRPRHLVDLPTTLSGKPLHGVCIGGGV